MILRPRPGPLGLLFVLRGSIVPRIAGRLAVITGLATLLTLADLRFPQLFPQVTAVPFTFMGLALSIFLGFRTNTCYARWWEARGLWGRLVIAARDMAREATALFPQDAALRRRLLYRLAGFARGLAAQLRGEDVAAALRPWLPPEEAAALPALRNPLQAVLRACAADLAARRAAGQIGEVLYARLDGHLAALTEAQTGCERIRNTPAPFAYWLLLNRTAWLFCLLLPFGFVGTLGLATPVVVAILAYTFFGLDELADELEEPFGRAANDLPLDALARLVEIDLREALGETDLPAPLHPDKFLLL
ncbi:bestrophin family protein [Roseomonas sp. GC11]|uniref:bestrophin family protein n=1 Tax=Roseomonas sp. GC11 TaxID=2950546 RepID=UPI00210DE4CC|nr:bestrophin family protein [Roseomonas sp. GC11]MCQ4162135.1 bestrophin family protein [Roseomonas sp. GC11]